ncbi:MAG: hypothetical protein AAF629_32850, partial [Chloroflexota bacterium]
GYNQDDPNDPWPVYCECGDTPNWIPAFNDLSELEFGNGYWLHVTQPNTLYLTTGETQGRSIDSFPSPPAIFFGDVHPAFNASTGDTVTAWIDDQLCGQTQIVNTDGILRYRIKIFSLNPQLATHCSTPGSHITLKINGANTLVIPAWQNNQLNERPLRLETDRFYLPIIEHSE